MDNQKANQANAKEIQQYVDILLDRGVDWGLIGPREKDRIWSRHIDNSRAVADLVPAEAKVVDVGSGAGLPGIPLALTRHDLRIVLLEPMLRRKNFLDQIVNELSLTDRVRVVRARAEDHDGHYDAVVARALAPLPRLLTWCLPLIRSRGVILALKGASADAELQQAADIMKKRRLTGESLVVRGSPDGEPTHVIRVQRS